MCGLCYACIMRRLSILALNLDEPTNYRNNALYKYDKKGKGLFFIMDLMRTIKLYEKGLLSAKQRQIIQQNEELFKTYFIEVKTALNNAEKKGIQMHDNLK